MTTRQASLDDLGRLVPLFDAYRVFYGQPSDPAAAAAFLRDRLARGEAVVLLAETPGDAGEAETVGFALLYPTFSSVKLSPIWVLNDLYVDVQARRCGVARALLAAVHAFATETGASAVVLGTGVGNTTAQRLYETSGFARDDVYLYARAVG